MEYLLIACCVMVGACVLWYPFGQACKKEYENHGENYYDQ